MSETPKPALLYALASIVLLEGVAFAVGTIYLVVEIFTAGPSYLGTAIAYAVTAGIFAALVIVIGRFTLLGRPWIRAAVVCLSVLQVLLAYSILITKAPTLGWILLIPAVAMIVLVFTPPVLRATTRTPREDSRDDSRKE